MNVAVTTSGQSSRTAQSTAGGSIIAAALASQHLSRSGEVERAENLPSVLTTSVVLWPGDPTGTPYRINSVFEENPHEYLPDCVGTLCDGRLLIAEAGRESEKRQGPALAKAAAARCLAQLKGGVYWIGSYLHSDCGATLRRLSLGDTELL